MNPIDILKQAEEAAAACNRCGFCTSYCPTYNATGLESQSPRGRVQTFRALLEGRLEESASAANIIDTCVLCGECTSVCFSEVPTAQLMVRARNFINETKGIPAGLRFILRVLLPRPKLLNFVLRLSFLGKKLGVSAFLRKTGLLQRFSPVLASADTMLSDVPLRFLLDYPETKPYQSGRALKEATSALSAQKKIETLRRKDSTVPEELFIRSHISKRAGVAYFPVCGSQYLRPSIGLSTIKLLKLLKLDFVVADAVCCGLPAASYGVVKGVEHLAKENLDRMEKGSYESILVDDSSCGAHLKDYPDYLGAHADTRDRAKAASARVKELSSYLLEKGLSAHLKKVRWTGGKVAYHDPCKAQYSLRVTEPPRELLSALPGLTLVPVFDSDQCCGGGGTYSFVHPDLSKEILKKKIANIIATDAQFVVTSSTSCLLQVSSGLRDAGSSIQALHLSEFLATALHL